MPGPAATTTAPATPRRDRARGIRRRGAALLLALALPAAGCASRWTLQTTQPSIGLQWPYQPNPPKVTYVRSLTGMARDTRSASALGALVLGLDDDSRNTFVLPVAVATARDGRIAVADLGRRCVHLYVPEQQRYLRLVGSPRTVIVSPVGVVFDDDLRLWVSDSTGRVLVFGPDGALLSTFEKAGTEPLQRPTGITYSPRTKLVYVVDTLAHAVRAVGPQGDLAFSFGARGDAQGQFNYPTHIFRSPAGELYVTDSLNFRVAIFDEQGTPLGLFGRHGDGSGDMAMPKGLAVDADGVVYVVDGIFDNVQLFDRRGEFLLTLGKRGVDFGEFWLPAGAFLADDQLYVCDTYNRRVQVFHVTERYAGGGS